MFGYVRANLKRKLCFNPQHLTINKSSFAAHNWYNFYRDSIEAILEDSSTPRVNVFFTHCFVDADHYGERATRIYQTGVLISMNKSTILWYSKI